MAFIEDQSRKQKGQEQTSIKTIEEWDMLFSNFFSQGNKGLIQALEESTDTIWQGTILNGELISGYQILEGSTKKVLSNLVRKMRIALEGNNDFLIIPTEVENGEDLFILRRTPNELTGLRFSLRRKPNEITPQCEHIGIISTPTRRKS